jgi:hypothetical protein
MGNDRNNIAARLMAGIAAATMSACGGEAGTPAADTVLFNGKVVTLESSSTVTRAVAVRGGKIQAVG